jgi:hypothetical protein
LEKSSVKAIKEVLSNGGYYSLDGVKSYNNTIDDEYYRVPYYLINDKTNFPPIKFIGNNVEKVTKEKLLTCIDNFKSFEKSGLEISKTNSEQSNQKIFQESDFNVDLKFKSNTQVFLDFPIKITQDQISSILSK